MDNKAQQLPSVALDTKKIAEIQATYNKGGFFRGYKTAAQELRAICLETEGELMMTKAQLKAVEDELHTLKVSLRVIKTAVNSL